MFPTNAFYSPIDPNPDNLTHSLFICSQKNRNENPRWYDCESSCPTQPLPNRVTAPCHIPPREFIRSLGTLCCKQLYDDFWPKLSIDGILPRYAHSREVQLHLYSSVAIEKLRFVSISHKHLGRRHTQPVFTS